MSFSTSIILIMIVAAIYIILVNIFAVLFRITGMSQSRSKFQAISIFTGVGFTTKESEIITSSKIRRKIATIGMITGNIFNVVVVSLLLNMVLSLSKEESFDGLILVSILFGIFIALLIFFNIKPIKKWVAGLIEKFAVRLMKKNKKENIITMIDDYGKGCICEIVLNIIPDVMFGKTLFESKIKDYYKMNIIMYERNNKMMDVTKDTIFEKGDVLIVFGSYQNISDCFTITKKELQEIATRTNKYANVLHLIDNFGPDVLVEIELNALPNFLKNKTLFESGLKEKYKINVAVVKRNGDQLTIDKDTELKEDDTIVVIGNYNKIKECFIFEVD